MKDRIAAILLMGGNGSRFGSAVPKQFQLLGAKKLYLHTLATFIAADLFHEIILVCHPQWLEIVKTEIPQLQHLKLITAGNSRRESSYAGLNACSAGTDYVVIHDAVRPFVSQRILADNVQAVRLHKAVDTCIASADTLVYAPNGNNIDAIPIREHYLRGQTPQSFAYEIICKAHQQSLRKQVSDDCALVLEMGFPVAIVPGEETNIKITTAVDLKIAELFLS